MTQQQNIIKNKLGLLKPAQTRGSAYALPAGYMWDSAPTAGISIGMLCAIWAAVWIGSPAGSILRSRAGGANMNPTWIMLGIIGWALGLMFVLVLMRMAGEQDRDSRHEQKRMDPYSDVTITHAGTL